METESSVHSDSKTLVIITVIIIWLHSCSQSLRTNSFNADMAFFAVLRFQDSPIHLDSTSRGENQKGVSHIFGEMEIYINELFLLAKVLSYMSQWGFL